ncbi:hypothetical protein SAMN04487851_10244 [Prevotella sp. tc2-28]|uniref:hypothetical protein n=1 Tax=Prevotella sp. tc2-28 TaxID=1761888 RepID=UPI00089C504B|nr:hypothetical protein [Prevotella sp. tc2-28]SEA02840.1 hypothetical protein SAMN04487851_10244 [Prevotella sp. tc2-28]
MSVHMIYYNDGVKMMRPVLTREEYMKLRNGGFQQDNVARIRQGDEAVKSSLVQMNYSCLPNDDGTLKGAKRMSTTVGMDVDWTPSPLPHEGEEQIAARKEEWLKKVPEMVLSKKDALGLLMLERSASKGFHLVFRRREELSQEDNLRWASDLLGVEYDKGAKDITRVFFTTTEAELIYLDDEIFRQTPSQLPLQGESSHSQELQHTTPLTHREGTGEGLSYNGIPYADIIAKYWELFNDGKEPVEGDRNALTFELAVTIRSICGYSLEKMMQVVPNYWAKKCTEGSVPLCTPEEEAEWRKTIENALKEPRKGMPYRLKQVLQALKSQQAVKACGGTLTTPPAMPKKLPPLIRLLTKNVPWFYKPAVANAVFPALGAHLHGVKFRYWDNVEHEATFMNILIGRQSIGKGTIKKPIEYIMEDIKQRDQPNRQREAEWKQKNPGAKQKKDPRPTDICIQMLIDNLTDAVFNQRIVDANNNGQRFIYTIVDEIEGLKKVTSKGTVDEVGLLIRKAFDNSDAGQERVGADSVSGIAPLRWNFNASTTPPNAKKFFFKMVNDGTVSRLDISTIIKADDDDDTAPIQGIYDHTFAQELKPYIDRLEAANGLIECPQSKKLSLEMKQENKDAAKLYESEAYRVFSYRANVIAWLKGMVLYVAHGYKWSKEIADFVRWTQQYNLWCKMLYFGQQLEKELREEVEIQRQSGPQNLLELLPDEFTKDQYRQMRQQQGKSGSGDGTLRSWQSRGYIVFDEVSGRYCKTEEYKRKFQTLPRPLSCSEGSI